MASMTKVSEITVRTATPTSPLLMYPPGPLFGIFEKEVTSPCVRNFRGSRE